jgi:hypothetical protein
MKLWLDDCRQKPPEFDKHVYTAQEAIELLGKKGVTHISLDHDLGDDGLGTGYDVARYIEEAAFFGKIPPLHWEIHSANPVGRENMTQALLNAEKYWQQNVSPEG